MTFKHKDFDYIDIHTHFFPANIFEAIWKFFEMPNEKGHMRGWSINYKKPTDELVELLKSMNVKAFTTLNYAHKKGVAEYINNWTKEFAKKYKESIPFGCVWPEDENRVDYVKDLFDNHNFAGIKVQPLVQNFYAFDERLDPIYDLIVDRGKWYIIHAGTAPYRNPYVGYKYFKKFIDKYPNMNVIVAHMGAFEYRKFLELVDIHENLYLDTAMIFIPNNIFRERATLRPDSDVLPSYQDRILFGSDFPNIPYNYERSTEGFLQMDLSKEFLRKIFFENAKKLFNLKV